MRILVTGGAGFIGSHYVRTLLTGGYDIDVERVTVLDKLTYAGNQANLDPVAADKRLTFVHGDICDRALLAELLPGHDAALNFAAETHVDRSIVGAPDFVMTNVVGTQAVMQACLDAGVPRVRARVDRRGLRLDRRPVRGPRSRRCCRTRRTPRRRRAAT